MRLKDAVTTTSHNPAENGASNKSGADLISEGCVMWVQSL
jgi:hypothetical protein